MESVLRAAGRIILFSVLPSSPLLWWLKLCASSISRLCQGSPSFRLFRSMSNMTGIVASADFSELLPITDPEDSINCILRAHESGKIGLVAAADRLEKALADKGFLQEMQLAPTMVGCDRENRGSQGVNALEVAILATDIGEVGWSWGETKHAICIEERPGSTTLEDFNRELASGTDLAPVRQGSIRFGSLSCTHTNMGLRSIAARMPSDDPLLSEAGRFCVDRLAQRDPEYAEAVRKGLRWKIVSWEARCLHPWGLQPPLAGAQCGFDHQPVRE